MGRLSSLLAVACLLLAGDLSLAGCAAKEVALFPSSGCYSHDVMMREVGSEFTESNVTWLQIHMYEFGFGMIEIPNHWNRLTIDGFDDEGAKLMRTMGSLIYEMNVPMDLSRPWDLRGIFSFIVVLQRNQRFCGQMLTSSDFQKLRSTHTFDLIVVDQFLQECVTAMASLLNATTVQFSNWPIADGYITSLNAPANPSSTPKTGTPFSSLKMTFIERVVNTIFHLLIILTRIVQIATIRYFYKMNGFVQMDMNRIESEHLFYAGRSELLFDSVRPINNRIKHFGCPLCGLPMDHRIATPSIDFEVNRHLTGRGSSNSTRITTDPRFFAELNETRDTCGATKGVGRCVFMSPLRLEPHSQKRTEVVLESAEMKRYREVQRTFPMLDLSLLEQHRFILVSFGSVAQVENMPSTLLDVFLSTFAMLNYPVVWQTNSDAEKFLRGRSVPRNVVLLRWAPLKVLLAHRNLLFFVCHGGINTINEVLMFGVPVLGVPLQGDQSSNLQRLVELGTGRVVKTTDLYTGGFPTAIQHMHTNLHRYSQRARKVAQMAGHYRSVCSRSQHFWLQWALKHGRKVRAGNRRYFEFFYRSAVDYFALPQFLAAFVVLSSILYVLVL